MMDEMKELEGRGASLAAEYVVNRLSLGKTLSKSLVRSWDFSQGSIHTTFHQDLREEASLDFAQGGQLAAARKRGLKEPDQILEEFLEAHLASHEHETFIVEDEMRRRGDSAVTKFPGRKGFVRDEVYCFLTSKEATSEAIKEILLKTYDPYLNVMILASATFFPALPDDGDEIEESVLEAAAMNATTLIVGAFHEEAHLVWTTTHRPFG